MRHLLLGIIRVYWLVWPRRLNRGCIYRETCSHHVYRVTRDMGLVAGLRALHHRVRTCRPGYAASSNASGLGLILRDGSFLPHNLVADDIMAPIHLAITELERRLSGEVESDSQLKRPATLAPEPTDHLPPVIAVRATRFPQQ